MAAMNLKSSFVNSLPTVAARGVVLAAAALALFIGVSLVLDPVGFQEAAGIPMPSDPRLASDLRGSGGVLVSAGLVMLSGAIWHRLWGAALVAGGAVYLSYGFARAVGMTIDGVAPQLSVAYTLVEFMIGGTLAWMAHRHAADEQGGAR